MDSVKAAAIAQIQSMPDDTTSEDVLYRLYVRVQVERGLSDLQAGRVITHEQVVQEIEEWLESCGYLAPIPTSDPE
jgi:predicted transcriptional regulator